MTDLMLSPLRRHVLHPTASVASRCCLLVLLAGAMAPPAAQATAVSQVRTVEAGADAVLVRAPCIVDSAGRPDLQILDGKGTKVAVFTAPRVPYEPIDITLEVGAGAASGKGCANGEQQSFRVSDGRYATTPQAYIGKAWTVLLTAFVLALLLEQAFALLFNWRLFLELVAGRAWRTPVMFAAAYAVSYNIDLDLIRDLASAYDYKHVVISDHLTRALTAAILAGGSVGVNHLLIGLGFRSQIRADLGPTPLDATQAWVAVYVVGAAEDVRICIDVGDAGASDVPTYAGTVGRSSLRNRLKDLFFPNTARFPRTGGYLVSTTKTYHIYALTSSGMRVGVEGTISSATTITACKFAPRTIVDLHIVIPPLT